MEPRVDFDTFVCVVYISFRAVLIRNIFLISFFDAFWSNFQRRKWQKAVRKSLSCLAINLTYKTLEARRAVSKIEVFNQNDYFSKLLWKYWTLLETALTHYFRYSDSWFKYMIEDDESAEEITPVAKDSLYVGLSKCCITLEHSGADCFYYGGPGLSERQDTSASRKFLNIAILLLRKAAQR